MRSFSYSHSYHRDGTKTRYVTLYEQPAWRELLSPLVYWINKRVPRWMQPGEGRPTSISHGDGTYTSLWRLRLEIWLCHNFHHDKRKFLHRFELPAGE